MNGKTAAVLLSGLLVACVQPPAPEATAPPAPAAPAAAAPAQPPAPAAPAAAAPAQPPAPAATTAAPRRDHIVSIQGAGCQDLLRLAPDDRYAASMFYIGYQASRSRARSINVGVIPSIEGQAVTYCEQNPGRKVAEVFAEAYSRWAR